MLRAIQEACIIIASVLEEKMPAVGRTNSRLYEQDRMLAAINYSLAPLTIRPSGPRLGGKKGITFSFLWRMTLVVPQTPVPLPDSCFSYLESRTATAV